MARLDYKKIGMIAGFILISIGLAYLIYLAFFKSTAEEPPIENINEEAVGEFPEAGPSVNRLATLMNVNIGLPIADIKPGDVSDVARGGPTAVKKISDVRTKGVTMSGDGNLLYYDRDKYKFYRLTSDGTTELLTDKAFYDVSDITWSPDNNKAILEYPDERNILYNFNTKKQVTLPKHWKDFSFDPTSDQIVFKSMGLNEENRWVAISNDDGSQATRLEHLGRKDSNVHLQWSPNSQMVGMYYEGTNKNRQELYFIGLHHENFKSTTIEGRGFQGQWTPEGDKLLYSVYHSQNEFNPTLWTVYAQGNDIGLGRRPIGLNTWAEKCAFADNENVYCGVPKELPEGAGLFPGLAKEIPDYLYKVNLRTGSKTLIADPYGDYHIEQMQISPDKSTLYFVDGFTDTLQSIKLK